MSLSKEPVFSELHNRFVCGYRDISSEPYAGNSGAHAANGAAVETSNGAGPHNIQMFVIDPDGTVIHCMPGYWNPNDLASELDLAEKLDAVWHNNSMTLEQKRAQFSRMQTDHFMHHSREEIARSHMQSFDRKHELERHGFTDTVRMAPSSNGLSWQEGGDDLVKTTDEVMHERMSKRPFLSYNAFDTAKFVDYGTKFYDKHEDNLDELGRNINPEAKTVTMRDLQGRPRAQYHGGYGNSGGGRVPHVQVKTYGRLRVSPQQ